MSSPAGRSGAAQELPLDDLLAETLERVRTAVDERQRLQMLLDTVISLAANLSLDGVLNHIVRAACVLLDGRYAALGVLGSEPDRPLRLLVHHGLSEEQAAKLRGQPRGSGLLGALIRDPQPLRVRDLTQHPLHRGLPPGLPEMRAFLGVPILIHGEVYGNLYVTEKTTAPEFSASDEKTAVALAAAAGVAIENARLYTEAAQRELWSDVTAEVTASLSQAESLEAASQIVVEQARSRAGADAAWLLALDPEQQSGTRQIAASGTAPEGHLGSLPRPEGLHEVVTSRLPQSVSELLPGGWPGVLAPITVFGRAPGVLALAWSVDRARQHAAVDPRPVGHFADRVSLALQALQSHHDHERIAVLEVRDRIAQDLHDVVIQRLFAIGLSLGSTRGKIAQGDVRERIDHATDDLDSTIREIRRTIFSLRVPETAEDVQSSAVHLVEQAGRILKFRPRIEFSGPVRSVLVGTLADDVLAVLAETLSNAARHARPTEIEVSLGISGGQVCLQVDDDGVGMTGDVGESGLANIRARARRHGGDCRVLSAPDRGTSVSWQVPVPAT